jgi:hypothetical protein
LAAAAPKIPKSVREIPKPIGEAGLEQSTSSRPIGFDLELIGIHRPEEASGEASTSEVPIRPSDAIRPPEPYDPAILDEEGNLL